MQKIDGPKLVAEFEALSEEDRLRHPLRDVALDLIRRRERQKNATAEEIEAEDRMVAKHTSGVAEPTTPRATDRPDS